MSHMAKVLAQMGVLPQETIQQFKRWGNPAVADIGEDSLPEEPATLDAIVREVDSVLQSKEAVEIRETDLDSLKQFSLTNCPGVLHVEDEEGNSADIEVEVGRLPTGEFVFPWSSAGIEDLMTNGLTQLTIADGTSVIFKDVRELFFGTDKAFMVCTPMRQK